jgi:hypothetical protein
MAKNSVNVVVNIVVNACAGEVPSQKYLASGRKAVVNVCRG